MRALVLAALLLTLERHGTGPAVLADTEMAMLRLEAPLDELFEKAKKNPDVEVDGTLTDTTSGADPKPIPIKVSLRGHTSRRDTECTFPKLKLDLSGGNTLKIGTHCGEWADDTPSGKYGRISNERSPHREAAVYGLLDAIGVPTLKARPARITYVYANSTLVRNALLLENDDEAIARLGGTGEIEAETFTTADRMFSSSDSATLAFAQALIGNFDWCLKFSERDTYRCDAKMKLWNILAVATPGGRARPVMYDFDLSGMVTGSHLWFTAVYHDAFIPSGSAPELEVMGQVQRTRSLFPRAELDATRRRLIARKADAYRVLEGAAALDANGRRYMREYLDAFYREIESDERFYRPVVNARDTMPRTQPVATSAAVCPDRGAIPIGTPVSEPIETRGDWIKVILLDAHWHWAPPVKCAPIQTGAVWIESKSISRDFPSASPSSP